MAEELPDFEEVQAQAAQLRLGESAAMLHGALAGWLAGGGTNDGHWLRCVLADDALPEPPAGSPLALLHDVTRAQLEDRDFGFGLLLPDAGAGLGERAEALFAWCRGFLGGFGLAAGEAPVLSEEGSEALADMARLAAAEPELEGDEEDEDALSQLEEFVRISALLLHGDCVLAARHRRNLH